MKLLLVNPPAALAAMFGVGREFIQKYEPLGLLMLAAAARQDGHTVAVLDAHAEELELAAAAERIRAARPDVVGISVLTSQGEAAFRLGRQLKRDLPAVPIVMGNLHAAAFAAAYLRAGAADVVVHGEGDLILPRLLQALAAGRAPGAIPGLTWRDADGRIRFTGPAEPPAPLDALPLPARDLIDSRRYRLSPLNHHVFIPGRGQVAKTMVTSRGCRYRCRFCAVHDRHPPRYRSAGLVVEELARLEREAGAGFVFMMDPLFVDDPARLLAICDDYRRRRLTVRWGCEARVGSLTPDLVRAMAAAGCHEISLGIESGVQRLLDGVAKGFALGQVAETVRLIKRHSPIHVEGLFILGLPGETAADSQATIALARSLPLEMAQFSICTPYPGSPLFAELAARGELDTGERPDGTLAPEVWQRYSSYLCFTGNEPIWVPPGRTAAELRALQKQALRAFYWRPRPILRNLRRLRPGNLGLALRIAARGFF